MPSSSITFTENISQYVAYLLTCRETSYSSQCAVENFTSVAATHLYLKKMINTNEIAK